MGMLSSRRFVAVCATAVLSASLLSACGFEKTEMATDEKVGISLPFKPVGSFSPYSDDALLNTRMGTAETLVSLDSDGKPEALLAQSWTMPDESTAVFNLRQGVKFHDGTELTAEAVVNSLNHAMKASSKPKGLGKKELTFSAVDKHTVHVTSEVPDPVLVQRFADPGTVILSEKAFDGDKVTLINTGTGPFALASFDTDKAESTAFADYWNGAPLAQGIRTTFIEDGVARANALRGGEVSLAQAVPIAQLGELSDHQVEATPLPRGVYLHLNTNKGVFADPAMRAQAAQFVEAGPIVENIYEGHAAATEGKMFSANASWSKDVISKNSLAGATDPAGAKIRLATWTERPELPEAASVVADQLRKAGFEVEVVAKEYTTLEDALLAGDFDAVIASRNYQLGAADPVSFLSSDYTCEGGYNLSMYCNEEIDKEINDAMNIADLDARYTRAAEIAGKIVADNAVIPLAHEYSLIVFKDLEGVTIDPFERRLITEKLAKADAGAN
ncbi:ABC transporter substrate-binding protein [Corynebacterium felinum]